LFYHLPNVPDFHSQSSILETQASVICQEAVQDDKTITHLREPERVLNTVIVVLEHLTCIERRINVNTLHLPGKLLLQRLEREQVVAKDEPVVEGGERKLLWSVQTGMSKK
jgi:hypothetical protein